MDLSQLLFPPAVWFCKRGRRDEEEERKEIQGEGGMERRRDRGRKGKQRKGRRHIGKKRKGKRKG